MTLTPRQKKVMQFVVKHSMQNDSPLGSSDLSQFWTKIVGQKISSATIRNELLVLERAGFLMKKYCSSGRCPSDAGYRLYINELIEKEYLPSDAIFELLARLGKTIQNINSIIPVLADILSELIQQTVIIFGYKGENTQTLFAVHFSVVRYPFGSIILLTKQGEPLIQTITLPTHISTEDMIAGANILNKALVGKKLQEIPQKLQSILDAHEHTRYKVILEFFSTHIILLLHQRYIVSGELHLVSNVTKENIATVKQLLQAIKNRDFVTCINWKTNEKVRVGVADTKMYCMENFAMVSQVYGQNSKDSGQIITIGPNNMMYDKILPLVAFVGELIDNMID